MDDLGPLLGALGTGLGSLVGGIVIQRRRSRAGMDDTQVKVMSALQKLAEVERALRETAERERDTLALQLVDTRHDLDDAERQLDDTRAELRRLR